MNPVILKYVGKTYQSGLLTTNLKANPYRETNLYCATQADIQPGDCVLDAGCGVCGPSIDIAQHIEGITIDAITLSPAQANTARELVQQAGLADQIRVHIGDFHNLPFADEGFDRVFFLESSGYSYNRQQLFSEVYRVLRPGGSLYIKEPFRKESSLSNPEEQELAELNQIYVYKIARMSEVVAAISAAGFQNIISRDLSEILNMEEITKTMFEYKNGFPILTEFGKFHYRQFKCLPTFFGEIKAQKPS
jgi:ubiquinone/menaquinone biosynthesis C-methylase UbiE